MEAVHRSIDDQRVRADLAAGQGGGRSPASRAWTAKVTSPPWAVAAADTSAVAVAAAMKADECLIYTDAGRRLHDRPARGA